MEPGHEVNAPATDDPTPLPIRVDSLGDVVSSARPPAPHSSDPTSLPPPEPTAASVLLAIAAANGLWFPSRFATEADVARDLLDEPLGRLRDDGLVRVAEWVRGVGQGYVPTPEGTVAASDPAALERLRHPAPPAAPPVPPPPSAEEGPTSPPQRGEIVNPPVVVPALLMANALWFFVCAVYGIRWGLTPARALSEGHHEVLHRFGAVHGSDLLAGEWWRLLTCCFVHIGAFHLIVNMLALAMMGPLAELLWGRGRLLLIYLISGLAGSALAMALRPDSLLAGASGAIWGIQMSLFAWLFAFRSHMPTDVANDWFRRLCVVFVLNAGGSFLPGVSWEGHLGGGVAGFLVAGLLNVARFGPSRRRAAAVLVLALLPVLCIGGVVGAMDAKGMTRWQKMRQRLAGNQESRASAEQRQKANDARTAFQVQVVGRVNRLAPLHLYRGAGGPVLLNVTPAELDAVWVLDGRRAPPARVAAARANVRALKTIADEVVGFTSAEPVGSAVLNRSREQMRAFAAARGKSFDLLLAMLDAPGTPPAETWAAWQTARAEAAALWAELWAK